MRAMQRYVRVMRHVCPAVQVHIPGDVSAGQKPLLRQADLRMPLQDHPAVLSAFHLKEKAGPLSGKVSAHWKLFTYQADRCLPLQDHPAVLSAFYLKEEAGPISVTDELMHSDGRIRLRAIMKYLLFKKGPLTTTGCDHGAFVSTKGECPGLTKRALTQMKATWMHRLR